MANAAYLKTRIRLVLIALGRDPNKAGIGGLSVYALENMLTALLAERDNT